MNMLKQAKVAGVTALLAVLAGCAGQVNEEAVTEAPVSEAAPAASTEETTSTEASSAAEEARIAAERLKAEAMAADTLFFFEFNKSDLTQEALNDLDAHAKFLVADRGAKARLEGHADERGTRAYNLALGERRANAVARYLVIQGVNRSQIETVSYGEERPLSLVRDESGWSRNRRVELIYQ
jgi:peptidoglycan-associated lipoprotein